MPQGIGELIELLSDNGKQAGRINCHASLVPAPGQYLLAHDSTSQIPLPVPIFNAGSIPGGFLAAPPIPKPWAPGTELSLRGPLGRGFIPPDTARRIALLALGASTHRLWPVLHLALERRAAVVLVAASVPPDIPPEVEIQPTSAVPEVAAWADYLAIDLERDSLPDLRTMLGVAIQTGIATVAQVLVGTDMPCGGLADCGVCAVHTRRKWKLACKDGPVFALADVLQAGN
jgi:hypothetical protein